MTPVPHIRHASNFDGAMPTGLSCSISQGMGLFFGAYLNLPNAYVAGTYPHAIAQARGVPFPFYHLGNFLGPLLLPLLGARFYRVGWIAAGSIQVAAIAVILVVAAQLTASMEARVKQEKAKKRSSIISVVSKRGEIRPQGRARDSDVISQFEESVDQGMHGSFKRANAGRRDSMLLELR